MTERNAMVEWERAEAREWNTGRNVDAWQRDPRGDETNVAYATSWPKTGWSRAAGHPRSLGNASAGGGCDALRDAQS